MSVRQTSTTLVRRCCHECGRKRSVTWFSREEWIKPSPCCKECFPKEQTMDRENLSETAEFDDADLDNPFAEGGFRLAVLGKYKDGKRDGQPCVCKWFKTGLVYEETYFDLDIKAMHKARELIKLWNQRKYIDKPVRINIPEVWTFDGSCSKRWKWTKVLVEPYIKKYTKFNSSSGWRPENKSTWHQAMQALSHFSYHITSGRYVLCDLQGGVYSNAVVLTDPVILSTNKEFGLSDLGNKGISSFFSNHVCNEFCRSNWILPANRQRYYKLQSGTSLSSAASGAKQHVSLSSQQGLGSGELLFPDPLSRHSGFCAILPTTTPQAHSMPPPLPKAPTQPFHGSSGQPFIPPLQIVMPRPRSYQEQILPSPQVAQSKRQLFSPRNDDFPIPKKKQPRVGQYGSL